MAFGRHIDGVARTHRLSFVTTTTAALALSKTLCRVIDLLLNISKCRLVMITSALLLQGFSVIFRYFRDDLVPLTDTSGLSDDVAAS